MLRFWWSGFDDNTQLSGGNPTLNFFWKMHVEWEGVGDFVRLRPI